MAIQENLVIVRGGGDLATGTIYKLHQCGYHVIVLETDSPSAIRRHVAFSEAVYQKRMAVEGVEALLAQDVEEALRITKEGKVAILADPKAETLKSIQPAVLVDAILAKKNLGTTKEMAPTTIALGPGFEAGVDVDAVIETMRGHNLGRVLWTGSAYPNTGVPGVIGGFGKERVIHAKIQGILRNQCEIGNIVEKGQMIAWIENGTKKYPVKAPIPGVLRGLIRDGFAVTPGFKIADIDPRIGEKENCFTISDKARCIAGGVLEAILSRKNAAGQSVSEK